MTGLPQPRTGSQRLSSKYKPRFQNPAPLPAIDEFRLDHILSKVLPDETAAVAGALERTSGNYQQDLRSEIRKVLAIEQKIQNKNIHARKHAHKLTKQLHTRRKRLAKTVPTVGDGGRANINGKENTKLGVEISGLLVQSATVSSKTKSLAMRISSISGKRAGTNVPDPSKYPYLSRILGARRNTEVLAQHDLGNLEGLAPDSCNLSESPEDYGPLRRHLNMDVNGQADEASNSSKIIKFGHERNSQDGSESLCEGSHTHASSGGSQPNEHGQYFLQTSKNLDSSLTKKNSGAGHKDVFTHQATELIADPESFEYFMDSSIAKYRRQKEGRYPEIDTLFSVQGTQSTPRPKKSPLRLLSAGPIGLGPHLVKLAPFLETINPLTYLFLPKKSSATVHETPELSLHKKLRIKVMPSLSSNNQNKDCECRASVRDPLSKHFQNALNICGGEILGQQVPDTPSVGEVWSSLEAHSETEYDSDNVLGSSSSSDGGSSSESLDSHISETNGYYLALQSRMKLKLKKLRHRKRNGATRYMTQSPTPKHQPLHRVLQPKQLILKLAKSKIEIKNGVSVPTYEDIDELAKAIPLKYAASPQASLVNQCTVLGTILQMELGHHDRQNAENRLASSDNCLVSAGDVDSQALDKLKSLVI